MKAFFGADLNNVVFQIKPYFVLYQCFMNKTVQNAYNTWCKVLRGRNLDGVKEIQYYSSGFVY